MFYTFQPATTLLIGLNAGASEAEVVAATTDACSSMVEARARYDAAKARFEESKPATGDAQAAMEASKDKLIEIAFKETNAVLEGTGVIAKMHKIENSVGEALPAPPPSPLSLPASFTSTHKPRWKGL